MASNTYLVGRSCEIAATTAALFDMAGAVDTPVPGCLTTWDMVVLTVGAIITIAGR